MYQRFVVAQLCSSGCSSVRSGWLILSRLISLRFFKRWNSLLHVCEQYTARWVLLGNGVQQCLHSRITTAISSPMEYELIGYAGWNEDASKEKRIKGGSLLCVLKYIYVWIRLCCELAAAELKA